MICPRGVAGIEIAAQPHPSRLNMTLMARSMKDPRRLIAATLYLLAGAVLGCGPSGPELGSVAGKVTLDGEPVSKAVVQFVPQSDGGTTSYGLTNDVGHYQMQFNSKSDGVIVGKCLVRITSDDTVTVGDTTYSGIEIFPWKYNRTSGVEVEVTSGKNMIDFDLESDEASRKRLKKKRGVFLP